MSLEHFRLTDRRALVTGGSRGLGRAMAEALVEAEAAVTIVGRSNGVTDVAAEIGASAVRADLSKRPELQRAFDEALEQLGGLDILVTSHGVGFARDAISYDLKRWDVVLEVNLTSVFELCQLAGRIMTDQKAGKVINVASMLSFSGGVNVSSYAASKGGVAQLTKALANEWARFGVNVNAIAPGYMKTDLTARHWRGESGQGAEILARLPAGRWGEPSDLKGAVVFLASHASDYVHGAIVPVDGGWLAR